MKKKLTEAYENGNLYVVFDKADPAQLHRWKTQNGVAATGKMIKGKYVVVFWDKLMEEK